MYGPPPAHHKECGMFVYDLIGIGFGPSNIALAIALDEQRDRDRCEALFIEKQPRFAWHPDMLLEHAHMQISFLKDLATLRNPTSRFTFINYLHQKRRLQDFINLKTFFPSRHEFSDYFAWAADQFRERCVYGEAVIEVLPEKRGREVTLVRVRSRDAAGNTHERLARNLIVSVGGAANIPECFRTLGEDPRVLHASTYLRNLRRNANARNIALIGAGQSAAEIFMDLHGRANAPQVDLILRARTIKPSDDSPFVNEIFNADFTDRIYTQPPTERRDLIREFRHTNYAGPDLDLIEQIYKVLYEQKVRGEHRHRLLQHHEVRAAQASEAGIDLVLRHAGDGVDHTVRYDAVVLATGYERDQHEQLLAPLSPYLQNFAVDRDYRLRSVPEFRPAIFLQGACESTHGLSDTLLSVTAVRTGEISAALHTAAVLDSHAHANSLRAVTPM